MKEDKKQSIFEDFEMFCGFTAYGSGVCGSAGHLFRKVGAEDMEPSYCR